MQQPQQVAATGPAEGTITSNDSRIIRFFILLSQLYTVEPIFANEVQHAPRNSLVNAHEQPALERDLQKLRVLDRFSSCIGPWRLTLRLIVLALMLKALFYVVVLHFHFGIFQDQPVAVEYDQNQTIYSFACIKSNCSRLFNDLQFGTMNSRSLTMHLPIFAICFPPLHPYYEPFQHEFIMGNMIFSIMVIYAVLVDVFVFKIDPYRGRATTNSLLLFLMAPNVAQKRMLERAEEHLREVRYSLVNFLEMKRLKKICELQTTQPAEMDEEEDEEEQLEIERSKTATLMETSFIMRSKLIGKNVGFRDGSLMDCIPLIRTASWHKILTESVVQINKIFQTLLFLLLLLFWWYFHYENAKNLSGFAVLEKYFIEAKCNIWLKDSTPKRAIEEFSSYDYDKYNMFPFGSFFICFITWPSTWGMVTFMDVLLSGWELRCWACELRYKLTMVGPLIRDLFVWPNQQQPHRPAHSGEPFSKSRYNNHLYRAHCEPDQVFRFDRFRAKFASEVHVSLLLVHHKSLKDFSARLDNLQQLEQNYYFKPVIHKTHPDENFEANLAELLEKFYIELRLMTELRTNIEAKISPFLVVIICANYLISLFCVYTFKLSRDFRLEAVAMLLVVQMAPIILIMNSVLFNTQVRKISPLIDSILADLSLARTGQLQHIRSLYWRLCDDLELTKAPRGTTSRFHLTYVTMIQVIFTVLTMFLFLLKT